MHIDTLRFRPSLAVTLLPLALFATALGCSANDTSNSTGAGGAASSSGSGTGSGSGMSSGSGDVFDAGSDPGRNNVQAGQVCERLSTIQCAGEAYCCDNPGHTYDECKQAMFSLCANDLHLDAVTLNPVSGFDPARAATAFTQCEALASQCDPSIAAFGASVDGLRGITLGTLDPGANCTPPNVLDVPQAAAALASCKNAATTACLPGLLQWTCAPRSMAGGPCFTDINCVDGLFCDNPSLALTGAICKPRQADATPCQTPNQCTSLACKAGACVPPGVQAMYCLETM
jgi:hypothetical protein